MKKKQMIIILAILVVVCCVSYIVMTMTTTTSVPASDPASAPASDPVSGADTVVEFDESTPGREPPFGRYVRFSFHEGAPGKYILAPNEIKVFDMQGVNVALDKPVTAHGHHNKTAYPKENAVDGDEDTLWHSRHGSDTDWIEVDLGKDIKISKIMITQDTGHRGEARMSGGGPDSGDKGSYITIKGTEPDSIWKTEDIKRVSSIYVYDFTKETGKWETDSDRLRFV